MADADAICEAVERPTMRFVAVKSVEQQALLSVHSRARLLVQPAIDGGERVAGAS